MTQDEIIEMASEAAKGGEQIVVFTLVELETFAKLVAAKAIKELEGQEPVAWKLPDKNVVFWEDTKEEDEYHGFKPTIPLYAHPPQRNESSGKPSAWVGLTVEEIAACCMESTTTQLSFYNAIEAKLKEKNT